MSYLASIIIKPILEWVYGKVALLTVWLVQKFAAMQSMKREETANDNQAAKVENVAEKIRELLRQGLPIPPELKEQLREESRRLIRDSFKPK